MQDILGCNRPHFVFLRDTFYKTKFRSFCTVNTLVTFVREKYGLMLSKLNIIQACKAERQKQHQVCYDNKVK